MRKWTRFLMPVAAISASCAVFAAVSAHQLRTGHNPGRSSRLEQWNSLPPEVRSDYIRVYSELSHRPDSPHVLASCDAFGALADDQKAQLRELADLMSNVIRSSPPGVAAWMRSLPGEARALAVYQALAKDEPERLARFVRSKP